MASEEAHRVEEELRDLLASWQAMAENVPGALFRYVRRPDGTDSVEYMSPACVDLWEIEASRIQDDATMLWSMIDPADLPEMAESIRRSAERLEPWSCRWRITTPSGKRKWLEGQGRVRRHADGSLHWNSLILDVTDRHRVDEALRASEERLALVLDVTGEGFWDWDLASGLVTHNRRWCELFGVDESMLVHPIVDYERALHEDDRAAVQAALRRCLEDHQPYRSEHRMRRADGSIVWVADRGDVVARDPDGRPLRMVGSCTDITVRKLAEMQLRIKDAAIESSLNGFALADLDARLIYVNPAFCRLWNITAEQAVGRSATEFWRTPDATLKVIDALMERGQWTGELEGMRADGSLFDAQVSASMVRSAEGQPLCMMASFVDVTPSRRAQAELELLNQQLEQRVAERTDELQRATAEAERANRAKSEFLSRMSHELRTPMNAVLGFGQLLGLDPSLSPRAQGYVDQLLRGGTHLLELINEVLDLASVEAGRIPLSLETIELAPLLAESVALVAPLAATRGVRLPAGAAGKPVTVRADRMRLKQVLMNLLSNAIKYNCFGGSVAISIEPRANDRVRVSVQDTGPGIPAGRLGELFQPFHRLVDRDSGTDGTGIGLVISRRLVELMGGEIGVTSEPGSGSTFWFELPRA